MAASTKRRLSRESYDVAILCPLEVELTPVKCLMDEEHARLPPVRGDSNCYTLGQLSGHNVVVASLPAGYQGKVSAANVANGISKSFPSITLRLLVGIGGGIPSIRHDIRLGDVVISTPSGDKGGVVEYDLGKSTITGFQRKGYLCPPPTEWLAVLGQMRSDHRIHGSKVSQFIQDILQKYPQLSEYSRPLDSPDVLFNSKYHHKSKKSTCEECDKSQIVERPVRGNYVHYGLIASGDRVIKNASEREKIAKSLDDVLCFEMEAAGLMNDFRCIVIRGISDYADSHKNDRWQPYAALAAAGVAKELLGYIHPTQAGLSSVSSVGVFEILKNAYSAQSRLQILRISGASLPMKECYINLSVIRISANKKHTSIQDRNRPWLNMGSEYTSNNENLLLDNLFEHIKDSNGKLKPVKRILIQGHAGVGKTTLCKKIVYEFLYGSMWHDLFDWVVWIPLRRLKQSADRTSYNLGDFLYEEYFFQHPDGRSLAQKAWEILEVMNSRNRCLFLLDGLDEVWHEWETGQAMRKFLHNILEMPWTIVTTRPYASGQHFVTDIDLEAETVGFQRQQILSYVNNSEIVADRSIAEDILTFLKVNPQLETFFAIPIQLDAMCYSWNTGFLSDSSKTMTSIYQAVVLKLWQKDIVRLQKKWNEKQITEEVARCFQDHQIERVAQEEVAIVEILAFTGLYNNLIEFNPRDRAHIYQLTPSQKEQAPLSEHIIEYLSFLRSSNQPMEKGVRDYYFLHLTFQEFFAARYFVRHWLGSEEMSCLTVMGARPQTSLITPLSFLQKEKYSPRYRIFWQFTSGLLEAGWGQITPTRDPLNYFFECVDDEPRDLLGLLHHRLIISCLGEVPRWEASDTGKNTNLIEYRQLQWALLLYKLFHRDWSAFHRLPDHLLLRILDDGPETMLVDVMKTIRGRPYLSLPILRAACSLLETSKSKELKVEAFSVLVYHHKSLSASDICLLIRYLWNVDPIMTYDSLSSIQFCQDVPESILHFLVDIIDTSRGRLHALVKRFLRRQCLPEAIIHRIALLIDHAPAETSRLASGCIGYTSTPSSETFRLLEKMIVHQSDFVFINTQRFIQHVQAFPEEFVMNFVQRLGGTNEIIRRRAARLFTCSNRVKPEALYDALFSLIHENEDELRRDAILGIFSGTCPPERLIKPMLLLLEGKQKKPKLDLLIAFKSCTYDLKGSWPENVVDSMIRLLASDDCELRCGALEVLSKDVFSHFQDFEILTRLFFDGDEREKGLILDCLRRPGLPLHTIEGVSEYIIYGGESNIDKVIAVLSCQDNLSLRVFQNLVQLLRRDDLDAMQKVVLLFRNRSDLPSEILEVLLQYFGDENRDTDPDIDEFFSDRVCLPDEMLTALSQVVINGPPLAKVKAMSVIWGHKSVRDISDTLISFLAVDDVRIQNAAMWALVNSWSVLPAKTTKAVLTHFKNDISGIFDPDILQYLIDPCMDTLPSLLMHLDVDYLKIMILSLTYNALFSTYPNFSLYIHDGKLFVDTSEDLSETAFENAEHEAEFRCRIQDAREAIGIYLPNA
ncbi:hypothetical protein BGW36DRAFT_378643 [Talaromyces proteolyticus]|uniref:NACHT domain-containing protein n=1 Tax=Talaromyces proteolyticus TaxID=1131652 RepID=A0AAD4KRS1_9EURO|nr:uncharacterized protein BGW36DRAFT_378643 [Talaromyces proteolyticus]KAH8697408.1 hypothetical protein BGW36DRAFT_378643 [Talaromyces proteolyticus]